MKKLIISSDSLRNGVKLVAHAINSKSHLPAINNMLLLRVTKGNLEMIGTDTELTVIAKFAAETPAAFEPFDLLVPFDFFRDTVNLIRSAPVTIEHPSVRKARIIEGDNMTNLDSLNKVEEFPKLPSIPKQNSFSLPEDFVELLHKAMITVSKDENIKPVLQKANLEINTKSAKLISTDIEAMYSHTIKATSKEAEQLLFSPRMSSALRDLKGTIEMSYTQKQVAFVADGVTICCTRFEDKFPDVKPLLQVKLEANLVLERSALMMALKKLCLNSMALKATTVYLTREEGKITFETYDKENARMIKASIPGSYIGEIEKLSINPVKLQKMMDQVDTENIRMHIDKAEKAIIITTEDNPDYIGLIMPLKINDNGDK